MKKHYDHGNSYERKHLIGTYSFSGLVHYPPGGEHGGTQEDMVACIFTSRSKGSLKRRERLGLGLLKTPSDILLPTRI